MNIRWIFAVTASLFGSGNAGAIPIHIHGDVPTTWESDAEGTFNRHPNNPRRGRGDPEAGDTRHQHFNTVPLVDANERHDPFTIAGVWDNRTNYNFVPSVILPTGREVRFPVAGYPPIPHGFIDETRAANIPRYRFFGNNWTDNNPNTETEAEKAQKLIVQAFRTWSALQAGISPVSRLPLITGLEFAMVGPTAEAEIDVLWGLPPGVGANSKGAYVRMFDANGRATSHKLGFNNSENLWFFGDPKDTPDNRNFFYTVALHEVGHVVGLDHQEGLDDIATKNIMFRAQREGAADAIDSIDAESMQGAFALYSIPVPEPSTLGLAGFAALGLLMSRNWRRRKRAV
jgi:hypothetical protein